MTQKKIVASIITSLLFFDVAAQEKIKSAFRDKMEIFVGTKIRVTPIDLKLDPNDFTMYNMQVTPLDVSDSYLSGFGSFFVEEKVKISNAVSLLLHQSIRRDFLVEHLELGNDYPYRSRGIENRTMYDLYAHLLYDIRKEKFGKIYLAAGGGISGLNTGHTVTVRRYRSGSYTDSLYKRNFAYPTVSVGFRWDRKRLGAGLIIGYCLKNPEFFFSRKKTTKFLVPEINFHYKLFGGGKKE